LAPSPFDLDPPDCRDPPSRDDPPRAFGDPPPLRPEGRAWGRDPPSLRDDPPRACGRGLLGRAGVTLVAPPRFDRWDGVTDGRDGVERGGAAWGREGLEGVVGPTDGPTRGCFRSSSRRFASRGRVIWR